MASSSACATSAKESSSAARQRQHVEALFAAEPDQEHAQEDQSETRKLGGRARFLGEEPRPQKGPDVSERDHRIQNREFALLDARGVKHRRSKKQHYPEKQPDVNKAQNGPGQLIGSH